MTKETYMTAYEEIERAVDSGSISAKSGMARIAVLTFEYSAAMIEQAGKLSLTLPGRPQ